MIRVPAWIVVPIPAITVVFCSLLKKPQFLGGYTVAFARKRSSRFTRNKYGAKRTEVKGRSFASKGEADCFLGLLDNPHIELLRQQVHVHLTEAKIVYIPDFEVRDKATQEVYYVEFKGFETDVWKIKKRLWKHYGPAKLEVWKKSRGQIVLVESIIPVCGV
jgi:hypothetical protein